MYYVDLGLWNVSKISVRMLSVENLAFHSTLSFIEMVWIIDKSFLKHLALSTKVDCEDTRVTVTKLLNSEMWWIIDTDLSYFPRVSTRLENNLRILHM